MINKFDYTFGVVLFILVWDLRAYYKNVLQQNLTRKQQEWVNNMRYPHLYKFTNLVSIVAGIGFLIFYIFFNFGYAYFYPLGAVLVLHFFKDFIRNIQKKESSVNDTLRMYKNDDIRMYNFDCITDTIVEVITTCNTYTLLTVHLL